MKKQLDIKKLILLNMPYILLGLFATNFGEAWRMAQGADASEKVPSFCCCGSAWGVAKFLAKPASIGLAGRAASRCWSMRLAVYLKGKDAKKYRKNGGIRFCPLGSKTDIAPFMDQKPENNIILTQSGGAYDVRQAEEPGQRPE